MSSGAGSKNPTSSSAPTQTQSSTKKVVNGKKLVKVEIDGTVVGEFASNWSTRTGDIIRSVVPVHYKDWRQVPKNFRNDVWNNLMVEFELDIPPEVARPLLEKAWPQKFRTGKIALRAHLKSGIEGPPDGMDPIIWEKFVENESDPKKKKQSVQNSENRKQLTYSHTLGRCTYGLKIYKMEQANPTQTYNNRANKWLVGHEDKNGCVLESAKPFYDKVKEAKLKRKSGEASSNTTENDELSEVFGKDQRGHVRGVGSHVTKKQLIHLGIAKAKEEANKVEKEGINALKDEFKSYVQEAVKVQFQDFQLAIQGTMQNMMADFNRGSPHVMTTPRSEFASNSVHRSCNLAQNLDNVFTPSPVERPNSSDKPSVILIDRENKELAKGYVVTDATAEICHGRKVGIGEKKVYIDEVLEPDAPLWFPQDGNDTFSAYVAGGYIIWFEPWLKYI